MDNDSQPLDISANMQLALKLYRTGELRQSVPVCHQILLRDPDNTDALHLLGLIAHQMGKNEAAVRLIEKAISISDKVFLYHNTAGNVYRALNKPYVAIACYNHAIALKPDFHEAHNNLGVVLEEQGKLDEAIACYNRAIASKSDFYEAHNNLGNALHRQGKLDEAVAHFIRAIELKPDFHMAHNNLASLYLIQKKPDKAIASYRRAVELKPSYATAWSNLGFALKTQSKYKDAADAYRHAIEIKPDNAELWNNQGVSLMEMSMLDQAIESFLKAAELKPDYTVAYKNMGDIYRQQGKFEEAMAVYRKAISADENFAAAYLSLTACGKFTEADSGLIETIRKMLEREDIKDEDVLDLRFALGKILDDLGRFGEAFSNYHEANRLENKKYKFDRYKHAGHISRLIETFTPEFFRQRMDFGSNADLPVMVLGMPRSGTTLVEQIVASHPRVHGAGELEFWNNTARKHTLEDIPAMTGDIAASIAGEYIDYLLSISKTARYITDKMPDNYLNIGLIHLVFPKARIIHVQRNPVDTCLSIYFHKFLGHHPYAYNLENLVFYYKQYQRLMSHWRDVLPSEVFYEVNYEELINDQENMSRKLIRFCGLPWDEKCLRFYLTERPVKTASNWEVRQPIYRSSVAKWNNYQQFLGQLAELLPEN